MGEKLVDVEDLLVWAADELSRKRPKPGRGAPALDIPRRDRECVGKYHWPRGYPTVSPMFAAGLGSASVARGEPPHADALTIEAAIGELRGFHLRAPAEADLRAGLGFDLDAPGAWAAAAGNVGNLLLVHARQGDRPSLGATLPAPVLAANGKPGTWRAEEWDEPTYDDHARASRVVEVACRAIRKDLYPPGAFCRLAWSPSPQSILNERGEYAAWRAGLEWLLERLRGEITRQTAAKAFAVVAASPLPLDLRGTAFQQRVWRALTKVPAGSTVSYSELAARVGMPQAVRAVASACARNHLAVVVPCHRVVRSDGGLAGYRWGVERKRELLVREGARVARSEVQSPASDIQAPLWSLPAAPGTGAKSQSAAKATDVTGAD